MAAIFVLVFLWGGDDHGCLASGNQKHITIARMKLKPPLCVSSRSRPPRLLDLHTEKYFYTIFGWVYLKIFGKIRQPFILTLAYPFKIVLNAFRLRKVFQSNIKTFRNLRFFLKYHSA